MPNIPWTSAMPSLRLFSLVDPRFFRIFFFSILLLENQGSVLAEDPKEQCSVMVKNWAKEQLEFMDVLSKFDPVPHSDLHELLFFLHIPRTGGRTYYQCFLSRLFNSSELCTRSYDKLRLELSQPDCRLLSTHDDYSLVSKLPKGILSVVTNMREPVGRVLSSYEFSIEVASRFLRRHDSVSAKAQLGNIKTLRGPSKNSMNTLDIWPWKYLVPFMQRDLFRRRDARNSGTTSIPEEISNHYDVPSMAIPIHEFIKHPLAHEVVHNGATFQVAGLTNNSYLKEAGEIRRCIQEYRELGSEILSVAKRRLDSMLYVGLTDKHRESATAFAHVVGKQVFAKSEASGLRGSRQKKGDLTRLRSNISPNISEAEVVKTNDSLHFDDTFGAVSLDQPEQAEDYKELLDLYQKCSDNLRSKQTRRRSASINPLSPLNFSKQAREGIPQNVISQILDLNHLDVELYNHAEVIFLRQQSLISAQAMDMAKMKANVSNTSWKISFQRSYVVLLGASVVGSVMIIFGTRSRTLLRRFLGAQSKHLKL